jgi:hypothetical protein
MSSVDVIITNIHEVVARARRMTAAHVRWPVIACALVALAASSAAFAASPMVDDPRLGPYTDAALDHVTAAVIVTQEGLHRLERHTRDLGLR